ncbi:hypothetical protein [Allorhizobium borbori]|uniref:Uncharacterized protein n=1 Tax=Allorhizobium borbori TaxID=485907 RepID=A0A7W6K3X4_9HYPH|nr:hypothetical protein [Allorhizobium borbori]MBB4103577.1 hypothetical protein [Allorhizobium borbori]
MSDISAKTERLDFFALETLVRCILATAIHNNPEGERLIRELFEASVQNFRLGGVDAGTEKEGRDYMLQRGLEWISSSAAWRPGHQ